MMKLQMQTSIFRVVLKYLSYLKIIFEYFAVGEEEEKGQLSLHSFLYLRNASLVETSGLTYRASKQN